MRTFRWEVLLWGRGQATQGGSYIVIARPVLWKGNVAVVAVLCPLGIASDTAGGGYRLAKVALGKEYQGRLSGGVKSGSATREGRQAIVSVVTAVAALAVIGLLFAMDPGGAIAESGFPDFRAMDWKQLAVWGFRTIGVVVAQLLIIVLWLWPKYRPPQALEEHRRPWHAGAPQPGSMPAAAVSALGGHMIWSPTLLASIIEMCQRGTLRIEAVGTRVGFLYRLSRQGPAQYDWERTICDSLPSRPTTVDALHEGISKRNDAIGDQLGEYLQHRGLFHDNPVRVRRENLGDGVEWATLAGALMGVGSGLWAALWLGQWWANALIGGFTGFIYMMMAPSIPTGMLPPTQAGAYEIGQWLGLKESLPGPEPAGGREQSDSMLAYAVALNKAEPWLDIAVSAPPWFGSGRASSLLGADLDAAYHGFMHAPEWWLTGRSGDAAKAAAELGYELELEPLELESPDTEKAAHRGIGDEIEEIARELEAQSSPPAATAGAPAAEYQTYSLEGTVEEAKGGGCLRGCFIWVVSLVGIGALVLVVLFSLDVVSPRDKPCPLDSPAIPTPAQIAVAGDLFRDECVRVSGTVAFQDADELVVEMKRGEYVQQVNVRDPSEVLEAIPLGRVVTLAGRLKVEEDGTYAVHFVPDHGSDRGWWRNLRENLDGLF